MRSQKKRRGRGWHRKPRNKTYARHIGTQSKIARTQSEIQRLEASIAEADRKISEASDRERYHELRLKTI